MKVILFSGQGTQYRGMGKDLWAAYRGVVDSASQILGYSIEEMCRYDPQRRLHLTQYTQPALYVVNALYYYKWQERGESPDAVAGHSLGEYSALLAAGSFDFETGLRLVEKRGELMGAVDGGMAAVLGMRVDELQTVLHDYGLDEIDLANLNSPTQTVISAGREAIVKAKDALAARGTKCVILNTSAPFHSRYMRAAQSEFATFLRNFDFKDPRIPVIANVTGRPYEAGQIVQMLELQIASPVRWVDSIRYMLEQPDFSFLEIGAESGLNGVLGKFVEETRGTLSGKIPPQSRAWAAPPDPAPGQPVEPTERQERRDRLPDTTDTNIGANALVPEIDAKMLGSKFFRQRYRLQYAYVAGAMYRGVASVDLVVRMARAGMMGYLGTGGMPLGSVEAAIQSIQKQLTHEAFGVNLLADHDQPAVERATVELYLRYDVRCIEAAAFLRITPALVLFRARGLHRAQDGGIECRHRILAKVSRLEVAEAFMSPAPARLVEALLNEGAITAEQASLCLQVPVSHDICVEADSGGHTDGAIPIIVFPAMMHLRQSVTARRHYGEPVCVGLAGGIGTPQAAAAAFAMGADFILTGSINQCTIESGATDTVKDLLEQAGIHDMASAPAGDMFEFGARVQVLKKGLLFPMRANKLHALYSHYQRLEDIPLTVLTELEHRYFKRTISDILADVERHLEIAGRDADLDTFRKNPKARMARVFRWYFGYSTQLAFSGSSDDIVNYQVHCGPALGAFNQWVRETEVASWRHRHVDEIALRLMHATAKHRYSTEASAT